MKKWTFKIIKMVKNITLFVSCILFFLAAIAVESAGFDVVAVLATVAILNIIASIFLDRVIVVNYKGNYKSTYCVNNLVYINEVTNKYHKWLQINSMQDTDDNFDYFYNKYIV